MCDICTTDATWPELAVFFGFPLECHVSFIDFYASWPNDEIGKDGVLTRHVHTCLSMGSLDFESVFFVPRFDYSYHTNNHYYYYYCLKLHLVFSPPCFSFLLFSFS